MTKLKVLSWENPWVMRLDYSQCDHGVIAHGPPSSLPSDSSSPASGLD